MKGKKRRYTQAMRPTRRTFVAQLVVGSVVLATGFLSNSSDSPAIQTQESRIYKPRTTVTTKTKR
jgi:hypothetical protein